MGCLFMENNRAHYLRRNGKSKVIKKFTSFCVFLKKTLLVSVRRGYDKLTLPILLEIFNDYIISRNCSSHLVFRICRHWNIIFRGCGKRISKNRPTHKKNVNKEFSYAFQGSLRKLLTIVSRAGLFSDRMHS